MQRRNGNSKRRKSVIRSSRRPAEPQKVASLEMVIINTGDAVKDHLFSAMRLKRLVEFKDETAAYVIEPYILGEDENGKDVLLGYGFCSQQPGDENKRWMLVELSKIKEVYLTSTVLELQRPGYQHNTGEIKKVHARLWDV